MRFCPNCGAPLEQDDKFCSACGSSAPAPAATAAPQEPVEEQAPVQAVEIPIVPPVTAPASAQANQTPEAPASAAPAPKKKKAGSKWKLIVIASLVGLLLIGSGIFVYWAVENDLFGGSSTSADKDDKDDKGDKPSASQPSDPSGGESNPENPSGGTDTPAPKPAEVAFVYDNHCSIVLDTSFQEESYEGMKTSYRNKDMVVLVLWEASAPVAQLTPELTAQSYAELLVQNAELNATVQSLGKCSYFIYADSGKNLTYLAATYVQGDRCWLIQFGMDSDKFDEEAMKVYASENVFIS